MKVHCSTKAGVGFYLALATLCTLKLSPAQSEGIGPAGTQPISRADSIPPGGTTSSDTSAAGAGGSELLARVTALSQLTQLQLTPPQVSEFRTRLSRLQQDFAAYHRREAKATAGVRAQLIRIQAALAAGQNPTSDDTTRVNRSLVQIRTEGVRLVGIRASVTAAIVSELSRVQLDRLRGMVGLPPAGTALPQPFWPGPSAESNAPGPGDSFSLDDDGELDSDTASNVIDLLDQAHSMPVLSFRMYRKSIASQLAQDAGASPDSPQFAAMMARMEDIIEQVHTLGLPAYLVARQQALAEIQSDVRGAADQAAAQQEQDYFQAGAEAAMLDHRAVDAFFVRDEALAGLEAIAAASLHR